METPVLDWESWKFDTRTGENINNNLETIITA